MPSRGQFSFSISDYDREISVFAGRCTALSAGNWSAQNALLFALTTAIQDATLGSVQAVRIGNLNLQSVDPASDAHAQRELKWLVTYRNSATLIRGSFELPCAKTSLLDPDHRPYAKLADAGPIAALVAAIQGFVLSASGNSIIVESIRLVGRAL